MKLKYTREELMSDHEYASPHLEAGYPLHGGFDAQGAYLSPRTLVRWPAVHAWAKALQEKNWPLVDASVRLMVRGNFPNLDQQRFLLNSGFGQTFWNSLTITGIIEARGKLLAEYDAPDLQQIIVEDISETACGHLTKGLLYAHGIDEGGPLDGSVGGHDAMWFAARDLLFGKDAYPIPEAPESIGREVEGREMPQIPEEFEGLIKLLMNVLMIEVRAENFFGFSCAVANDAGCFSDRKADASHAAELIDRIRTDEAIHVAYLQAVVSELRSFTFKGAGGEHMQGAEIIDPVWKRMVEWHSITNSDNARKQGRETIFAALSAEQNGRELVATFDSFESERAA
jgi:hypothetical protein